MATTTVEKIRSWLDIGRRIKATHMLVIHDSFDSDGGDFATFAQAGEDPHVVSRNAELVNGQRVIECYAFHLDIETQLNEHRAIHYEIAPTTHTALFQMGLDIYGNPIKTR